MGAASNAMSPRGSGTSNISSPSPRSYLSASPRNSMIPLVFGSNPLSPRGGIVHSRTPPPPRSVRALERRSSQSSVIPESPSGNYRGVHYLSEDEKLVRLTVLHVLIQNGILDGDPNEYPIRNIHQPSTPPPQVNHKLGALHKKMSACFLDYLNFSCCNGLELETKIFEKYVHLYINGIDSDSSDDDEKNNRRRRLWNVGNSGKDSYRTSVELVNWLQYETSHLPVFYSLCKEELVSRDFVWHCRKCRACVDWQYYHCNKCEKCVWGVNLSDPHICPKASGEILPVAEASVEPQTPSEW